MRRQTAERIEKLTGEILQTSGAYRIPVPIEPVLSSLDLKATPSSFTDDMSGLLLVENKRGAIGYNSSHASVRQRFTIAHEIGHYVLHVRTSQSRLFLDRYVVYRRDDKSSTGNDREETEANAFAAALLMPSQLLRREIAITNFDLDDDRALVDLSRLFKVSATAMSIRLSKLNLLR
jgi:Zn-dependent peptidase ImmA (M78 family)